MYEMSQWHPVWVAENHVTACNSASSSTLRSTPTCFNPRSESKLFSFFPVCPLFAGIFTTIPPNELKFIFEASMGYVVVFMLILLCIVIMLYYNNASSTLVPSNAHILTPFFQKTVFFSKIFFGKPP